MAAWQAQFWVKKNQRVLVSLKTSELIAMYVSNLHKLSQLIATYFRSDQFSDTFWRVPA